MALRWRIIQEHASCSPRAILQCDDGGSWEDVRVVDDNGYNTVLCAEISVKSLRIISREPNDPSSL